MPPFRIRRMPALLGYPILGTTGGCLIAFASASVIGFYYVILWPLPLLAAALGVAAAREWDRPAQRAFVGGCLGVMLATLAWLPFHPPGVVLPALCVGLAAGAIVSYWVRR